MAKKMSHLDDEQIMQAVIDRNGLDEYAARHLFECSECRAEKEVLETRLAGFGKVSRTLAPADFRKPRFIEKRSRAFRPAIGIRPALGMGMALASILAVLLNPFPLKKPKVYTLDKIYQEMLQDERFMTEIEKLEEEPLPRFYVEIAEPGDDDADIESPGVKNGTQTQDGSRNV